MLLYISEYTVYKVIFILKKTLFVHLLTLCHGQREYYVVTLNSVLGRDTSLRRYSSCEEEEGASLFSTSCLDPPQSSCHSS